MLGCRTRQCCWLRCHVRAVHATCPLRPPSLSSQVPTWRGCQMGSWSASPASVTKTLKAFSSATLTLGREALSLLVSSVGCRVRSEGASQGPAHRAWRHCQHRPPYPISKHTWVPTSSSPPCRVQRPQHPAYNARAARQAGAAGAAADSAGRWVEPPLPVALLPIQAQAQQKLLRIGQPVCRCGSSGVCKPCSAGSASMHHCATITRLAHHAPLAHVQTVPTTSWTARCTCGRAAWRSRRPS